MYARTIPVSSDHNQLFFDPISKYKCSKRRMDDIMVCGKVSELKFESERPSSKDKS